jgi:hypothetical protein
MHTLVAFPVVEQRLLGRPPYVRLTDCEARAMEKLHLGGPEALRTPTYSAATSTVSSLIRKGLLDNRGLTEIGVAVGKSVAESRLAQP